MIPLRGDSISLRPQVFVGVIKSFGGVLRGTFFKRFP